jgi:hypothetical protein
VKFENCCHLCLHLAQVARGDDTCSETCNVGCLLIHSLPDTRARARHPLHLLEESEKRRNWELYLCLLLSVCPSSSHSLKNSQKHDFVKLLGNNDNE